MKVFKFGGTSVGNARNMRQVARLLDDESPKVVVLSAVAGMTNTLAGIVDSIREGKVEAAHRALDRTRESYAEFLAELLETPDSRERGWAAVKEAHQTIAAKIAGADRSAVAEGEILAQGESVSTQLFQLLLEEQGRPATLLSALEFMRLDADGEPDLEFLQTQLPPLLAAAGSATTFITQGYICRDASGTVSNLQRGGSDYTATLIGAALDAEEIQIWTDIDGLHHNDPRIVEHTRPVRQLSYREAAELAYFGAKILHPTCVIPAERRHIPIRLKNTFHPEAPGTLISDTASGSGVAAIAAKDGITAIRIRSSRMLNAYGFLRRVFEVFEAQQTPIDMITTSEVAVSLTIDNDRQLPAILADLARFGEVQDEGQQTIICLVGDQLGRRRGYAKRIFTALADIPIRAVSYGGSDNNVTLLVETRYKAEALRALNRHLFAPEPS